MSTWGNEVDPHIPVKGTSAEPNLWATTLANFPQAVGRLLSARLTPPDELDRVDSPIASFRLVDEGMGLPEPLAQLPLRKASVQPPFSQQFAEFSVGRIVLGSCSHAGNTL